MIMRRTVLQLSRKCEANDHVMNGRKHGARSLALLVRLVSLVSLCWTLLLINDLNALLSSLSRGGINPPVQPKWTILSGINVWRSSRDVLMGENSALVGI